MTVDEFFAGYDEARPLFAAVQAAIDAVAPAEMRITKSQIAYRRRRGFAWVWLPRRYLAARGAPLVLSVALASPSDSPRWKQIVQPAPGRYMHHLELSAPDGVDDEVRGWLREAWELAG